MPHPPTYETFEHGADIGVRGIGHSLEEALAMAAKAMFSLTVDNVENVPARNRVEIRVEGFDMESLLQAWLNQLLASAILVLAGRSGLRRRMGHRARAFSRNKSYQTAFEEQWAVSTQQSRAA